jgi:hypothetical protein
MICANKDCPNGKEFTPKTHNQKYCNEQCCRISTNRKIMEKYYEKKAIKNGAPRVCKSCKTKLSRYNQQSVCSTCEKNINHEAKIAIWSILNELS